MTDNEISETRSDGTKVVRFKPTPAYQTPDAMGRLHTLFGKQWDRGEIDPLLLIPTYVLDRTGDLTTAHGAKTESVLAAIRRLPETFRYADLARACPNVSRPTIKRVLGKLRQEGKVECIKAGRDAVWEKKS